MDIKHPQILVVRRKMDCVLLKRRKERQITLTDWAKGCAGSGPALISRLGHPSLHQAPLARCLNPRRWPWQLREAPLEGRNLQHSTVTCSTRLVVNPATGWAEGFAYLPKQGGGARSCVGFSAKAPDDPVSSCRSLAGAQHAPGPSLPMSKHAGSQEEGWRGRNSISPLCMVSVWTCMPPGWDGRASGKET